MDKDQLVNDFFRVLRATLTNSFSYPKDHPYFIKSVDNFKLKLEELLAVLDPLKIGITGSGIMLDGKNLNRAGFGDELAQLLHRRKIKSIEIRSGVTLKELVSFFSVISLRQEEIIKSGGVNAILDKQALLNFTIEELDYSVFLHEEGQEVPDVWGYMLKDALTANDEAKINKLADNFGTLIKRSNQDDIFQTPELPASVNDFLSYLKTKDKEKFAKCSKELFLWLLHNKEALNEEKLTKLAQLFNSLSQEDFSNLFLEGVAQEENFDALSLQFFSRISEQRNPAQIAQGIFTKINASQYLNRNPRVVKRIQDLLTHPQEDQISAVYRNTLESLVKGISFSGELFFDQKELKENYRYIVLNMFASEADEENLSLVAEILEQEWASAFEENNLGFLKDLASQLAKRKKEGNSVGIELEKKFSVFVENIILNRPLLPQEECLLEMISSPGQEANFYLDKIFTAETANPQLLGLFFKLFPGNLDIFYQRVEQRIQDLEFIFSLIGALGVLAVPGILGILDHIYVSSNELIKVEILNTMRKLKKVDAEFLTRQLNTNSPLLRKNILSVLILDAQVSDGALDLLLKIPGFCGSQNELLIENMQIVFDLGLIEAAGRIRDLERRRFLWNRKLRAKAKQILKEWNA